MHMLPIFLEPTPSVFCPNYPAEIPLAKATCDLHVSKSKGQLSVSFYLLVNSLWYRWSGPILETLSDLTFMMLYCPEFCPPTLVSPSPLPVPLCLSDCRILVLFSIYGHTPGDLIQFLGFKYNFYWWPLNFYLQPSPFPSPRLVYLPLP